VVGRKREGQVDVVGPEAVVPKGGLASLCGWLGDVEEDMGRRFFGIEMASLRHFFFFEEHCFPKWWVEQPAEDCAPETALANKLFTLSVTRHVSQPMGLIPQQ
jgi:hypothetical protein